MELVTIFRDFGKDSGVVKINLLCPRGGDAGFCPRGAAGAVVGTGVEGDGCAIE